MSAIVSTAKLLATDAAARARRRRDRGGDSECLWAYYGTAVFFEVVRAGWAACF